MQKKRKQYSNRHYDKTEVNTIQYASALGKSTQPSAKKQIGVTMKILFHTPKEKQTKIDKYLEETGAQPTIRGVYVACYDGDLDGQSCCWNLYSKNGLLSFRGLLGVSDNLTEPITKRDERFNKLFSDMPLNAVFSTKRKRHMYQGH